MALKWLCTLSAWCVLSLLVSTDALAQTYPPTSVCTTAGSPPVSSGTTPVVPGRWWNYQRSGTGWDLNFITTGSTETMSAIWYTYDKGRRPVWILSTVAAFDGSGHWNAQLYNAQLLSNVKTTEPIGQMWATQIPGAPTQLAITWQWNDADTTSPHSYYSECIQDFFESTKQSGGTTQSVGVPTYLDPSYSGAWDEVSAGGYMGLYLTVARVNDSTMSETDGLAIYDTNGYPVWLESNIVTTLPVVGPPPSATYQLQYSMSGPTYTNPTTGGIPTENCSDNTNSACHAVWVGPASGINASITHNFTSSNTGTLSFSASVNTAQLSGVPSGATPQTISWYSPGQATPPGTTNNIQKLTDASDLIFVNATSCTVPTSEPTCSVVVDWNASSASSRAYQVNESTGVSTGLGSAPVGNYEDNLPPGARVHYELRSGSTVLARTNTVVTTAVASTAPLTPSAPTLASAPADDTASDSVGATTGKFSVDQGGNAQYEIPIMVPRGRGGFTPALSLTYNSAGSDGVLGWGWSITGTSSISLCRLAQEHGDGPGVLGLIQQYPTYGAQYCLDGERMVLIQGPEGTAGAEYRLEHDDQTLVVVESTKNLDNLNSFNYMVVPNVFTVYGKDGSIRRFGGNTASLGSTATFNPINTTLEGWYEYERRDSNNNVITFSYLCARNAAASNTITDSTDCSLNTDATRNTAAITLNTVTWVGGEIDFNPQVRPTAEQAISYQIGNITQRWRVPAITVKSNGTTLRTYSLATSASPANAAVKQVQSIKECVGAVCLAPTTFQWDNLSIVGVSAGQNSTSNGATPFSHVSAANVKFGDIDGDGRTDIVWLKNQSDGGFHAMLSQPSSSGIGFSTADLCATANNCPVSAIWGDDIDPVTSENYAAGTWQLLDFNGDGRSDLLTLQSVAGGFEWEIWLSNGAGFPSSNRQTAIRLPIGSSPGGALSTMPYNLDTSGHARTFVADFDGDGLPDLLVVGDGGSAVYLMVQTGNASAPYAFQGPYAFATGTSTSPNTLCFPTGLTAHNLRVADFNGDGRADIVMYKLGNPCAFNTGAGPAPSITALSAGSGNVGTTIQLTGTNFSSVATENRVQFNGALAAVTAASTTQLSVVVPSGATTGFVAVTVGSTTGVSPSQFTVTGLGGETSGTQSVDSSTPAVLQVLTSNGTHDATNFYFNPGYSWVLGPSTAQGQIQPLKPTLFQVVDLNGDGLADVVFGVSSTTTNGNLATYFYQINNGVGFQTPGCVVVNAQGCVQTAGADQVQVGDYDGDGQGDVWIPATTGSSCTAAACNYNVYEYTGNSFAAPILSPLYASDISSSPTRTTYQVDLDGDGYPDTLMIDLSGGNWSATRFTGRYNERNVIGSITSGLHGITNIDYAPLTFNSLYYAEHTGPQLFSGWGAPVQDVLTPRYLVQYVDSSAPLGAISSTGLTSNTAATSRIRYRYGGFKMQGFGRGSLGFDSIYSTDQQTNIETVTTYKQPFPFTGTPFQTTSYLNADSTADNCLSTPDSVSCMNYINAPPTFSGFTVLNQTNDSWRWHARGSTGFSGVVGRGNLTTAVPINLFHWSSTSAKYGLDGTLLSSVNTNYGYDDTSNGESYGNVTSTTISEYSSATSLLTNLLRQTTTTNTYQNVITAPSSSNSYQAVWHLGRLATSISVATPWSGGTADSVHAVTRNAEFAYDPTSGQLTAEHLQPLSPTDGAPAGNAYTASDKFHFYDAYGNETETVTCSQSAACSSSNALTAASMTFDSTDNSWVQRYTKSTYDSNYIYPMVTFGPFWNGSSATEHPVLTVSNRNAFGDPLSTTDMHNVVTQFSYSALGRQYFIATNTGGAQQTIYRWCVGFGTPSVPCPAGAAYRMDVTSCFSGCGSASFASRSPETWTYFDVLARSVLTVQQDFTSGQYRAVAQTYDNLGRLHQKSEPYFTYPPTSASIGSANGAIIYATTMAYDVLGRTTGVLHPNNSTTTTNFSGLNAVVTLPLNGSGYTETRMQLSNLLGQVFKVTDSNGSTLTNYYDASGNPTTITRLGADGRTSTVSMSYDQLGRRYGISDPDGGTFAYQFNALGQQVLKNNYSATPTCTATLYDGQGRIYSRADFHSSNCTGIADANALWTFDTASSGLGLLAAATNSDSGTTEVRNLYYDSYGRPIEVDSSINGTLYRQRSTYDQYGRPFQSFFSGTGIAETSELYLYNPQGYGYQTQDAEDGSAGQIYQTTLLTDARGHVTQEYRANNQRLTTVRGYDSAMGWLTSISTGSPVSSPTTGLIIGTDGTIESLAYTYDVIGNVMTRADTSSGASIYEWSTYDNLQRLTQQQTASSSGGTRTTTLSNAYDSFGNPNPTSTLYGSYTSVAGAPKCTVAGEVATPGPDALTGDTGGADVRCYDAHGNVTRLLEPSDASAPSGVKRASLYTDDDHLRSVEFASPYSLHTTSWFYGLDRQRLVRQDYANDAGSGTPVVAHFVGSAEIDSATATTKKVRRYLGGMILSQTVSSGSSTLSYEFLYTDNIGSTHRIVDQNGNLEGPNGAQWFTPYGIRASSVTGLALDPGSRFGFDDSLTHHAYTGHEQMDEVSLTHMNGRVYDANGTHFEQTDPFISDAEDLQAYNRYAYLRNNPLASTDPTGYWGARQQGYVREAAAIAITVYTGFYYAPVATATTGLTATGVAASGSQVLAASVAAGYTSGFISSGNLKGAVLGGLSAGVDYGIGSAFPVSRDTLGSSIYWENIGSHALAGGVVEVLGGGKFGHGFITAGGSAALSPVYSSNAILGGLQASIMGGTLSSITGGKFANGALTAAFEYSFNCGLHECWEVYGQPALINGGKAGLAVLKGTAGTIELVAGEALSDTGIGSVLGVPLMAYGSANLASAGSDYVNIFGYNYDWNFLEHGYSAASVAMTGKDYGRAFFYATDLALNITNYARDVPVLFDVSGTPLLEGSGVRPLIQVEQKPIIANDLLQEGVGLYDATHEGKHQ